MLLVLMYHRIYDERVPERAQRFRNFLRNIAEHYPVVLPGEDLTPGQLSICLAFDDAYADFYYCIYPMLRETGIRALLAVSPKFIIGSAALDGSVRLCVPYDDAMKNDVYFKKAPFCTWEELSEMISSGLVQVASHSFGHSNLTGRGVDLTAEIVGSKAILEEKLPQKVSTFVYPYGSVNRRVHSLVRQHYSYAMRIGSALNRDWHNFHGMIYRVDGENLVAPAYPLKYATLAKYFLKYLSNTVRRK